MPTNNFSLSPIEPLVLCHTCNERGVIIDYVFYPVVLPYDAARHADGQIIDRAWKRFIVNQMSSPNYATPRNYMSAIPRPQTDEEWRELIAEGMSHVSPEHLQNKHWCSFCGGED